MTLLKVDDLKTYYTVEEGEIQAVDGVSFELKEGESLGLVGESGSGKSTIAKSIIRLMPENGEIVDGEIKFRGTDILALPGKQLRKEIRWKEISMIPQEAMNGFDPVYTVGEQIVNNIRYHEPDTTKPEARERAKELFEDLGLDEDRIDDYPHQFSGGMAQRAMIALALCLSPSIVLADEPTTALDVVIQDQILDVIKEMQQEVDSAIILVTHDMSVVSETCDTIAVTYAGQLVEIADAATIIKEPRHPYSMGLRNAFPDITATDEELISIPGSPPDLFDPDDACRFAPRCPFAEDRCWNEAPEPEEFEDGHVVECHRADEAEELRELAKDEDVWVERQEDSSRARTPDVTRTHGGNE
jgi:peptide/nickel transport system ATP-binding protein